MLLRKRDEDIQHPSKLSQRQQLWSVAIATGALTAVAYFLGARLGLVLLTDLEGVAVFWPASGVAAGILIALGPRSRMPVGIGVVVATIAANLLGDRSLLASIFSGFALRARPCSWRGLSPGGLVPRSGSTASTEF